MSTKPARSVVPITEICLNCKGEMTITGVMPILLADGLENVTYRCKGCRSEMKRTFKRRSGAWQLIRHTPEFPYFPMGVAFEMTCAALKYTNRPDVAHVAVAKRIIELAKNGVLDPDRLCERVLDDLRKLPPRM